MDTPVRRRRWRRGVAIAAVVLAAAAAPVASATPLPGLSSLPALSIQPLPPPPTDPTLSRYIIMAPAGTNPHSLLNTALLGSTSGGFVADLTLINGLVADLTTAEVALLPANTVTPDVQVLTQGMAAKGGPKPPPPPQLVNVFRQVTGASAVKGNTGQGIGVAVVDTGIAPLPDFDTRLKPGVDLSGEANPDPTRDGYGHGTFVAGLIAGNGASNSSYVGEAPGANLYPVKVAGADGSTHVSTLILGLQWIHDNPAGINVVNMSLGAAPVSPTLLNPLDQAVEVLWRSGFVVVTSAGNEGPADGSVTSPGDDPLVVTVGALDDKHTVSASDDTVPDFSSRGPTGYDGWWKPDLIAPGRSLVSVMPQVSTIRTEHPEGAVGTLNFVGSGTSFSAAVTSGAAAMLLHENTAAKPDNVKAALLTTTNVGPGTQHDPFEQGHGVLNVAKAVAEPVVTMTQSVAGIPVPSLGTGIPLIDTQIVSTWATVDAVEQLLYPQSYPFPYSGPATTTSLFQSAEWNSSEWNSKAWNGKAWNSKAWNGATWNSKAWNDAQWNGATWS